MIRAHHNNVLLTTLFIVTCDKSGCKNAFKCESVWGREKDESYALHHMRARGWVTASRQIAMSGFDAELVRAQGWSHTTYCPEHDPAKAAYYTAELVQRLLPTLSLVEEGEYVPPVARAALGGMIAKAIEEPVDETKLVKRQKGQGQGMVRPSRWA